MSNPYPTEVDFSWLRHIPSFYNFTHLPILMSPCSSHSDTTTAPAAIFKLKTRHRLT